MGLKEKLANIWSNVTLEPALFLFFVSHNMDMTTNSQMLIMKVCLVDMQQPREICDQLKEDKYDDLEKSVQDVVSQFDVYNMIVEAVVPMLLAFYIGAWCDLFGRKVIMYLFVIFMVISQILMALNAYFITWPKEYMLISYFVPTLVGSRAGFFSGVYAFIADISTPRQRAVRMGYIQLVINIARPVAQQLGKYVYNETGFFGVNATSAALMSMSGILLYLRVNQYKWIVPVGTKSSLRHLFALSHVTTAIHNTFKRRSNNKHIYIWCALFVMCLILAPIIGEGPVDYLYVQKRYQWGVNEFSNYKTAFSIVTIVSQFILIQLVDRYDLRETTILLLCCCEALGGHLVKGIATKPWIFYLSVIIDLNGNYATIVSRAIISQCVPLKEMGQVMAINTFAECLLPVFFSQMYSSVWKATADTFVGAIRFVSAEAVLLALIAAIYMHWHLRGKRLRDLKDWEEDAPAKEKKEEREIEQNQSENKERTAKGSIDGPHKLEISTVF